ncbi:hypothetical protein EU528_01665 [Candidatus Thorarchaeota archaeon]|nr:MAG: hypothetical protein EU528_01665 [Candidatus Thorarchaeota archaeon]
MRHLTNSHKYLRFAVILALMISLVLPVSLQMNPLQSQYSSQAPFEVVSLAAVPSLNLTYHTFADPTAQPVTSNSILAGDHVILTAEWNGSLVERSRLEVHAPVIPTTLVKDLNSHITEIDTRGLGNNLTCIINATAWFSNGSVFYQIFSNVLICNFFVPSITVIAPNGNEIWSGRNNITWSASDVNVAEVLRYDVLISANGGTSFDTLASSITAQWLEWDCTGLDKLDTYLVEVRVTDGIYFSSDCSDSTFTAGDIVTSTTSTTTTSTTTETNTTSTLDARLTAFIAILVVSSSIMAIVVYYAARKWF